MLRIEQMYAFVALDDEGVEGICAFFSGGVALPMVGADMKRVNSLRPLAQQLAHDTGMEIRLLRFEVRTELEVIEP